MADWGPLEGGGFYDKSEILETHKCTPEELGLEGDNSGFYPLDKTSQPVVSFYRQKFLCISREKSIISGNFSSAKARNLRV